MNVYYDPGKFGLTVIGEVDFGGGYDFDKIVVWRRDLDGRFVYATDSGCSCPMPFESVGVGDLTVLRKRGGLSDLKKVLDGGGEIYQDARSDETVRLIERVREAGLR